ncbi:MAG: serine/threonine-protein kinase [Solirubrobacteraceae bacterium]
MAVNGDLKTGSVVGGYRVDELISRGGMGVVYRVTNVALNRIYALKVLAPELAEDVQFRERFKRETRIAASLHHPNVVGIHYAGEHEGLLFFVMDYVTGTDLRRVLVKTGALDPARAVDVLEQSASALDAAHRSGLVHRDVKPGNILITVHDGEEHAYLTDFGLAKRSDAVSALTAKGLMVGTVDYMAPEQVTGAHTDARTDIYALGCVFFQMLSGRVPYERENSVATLFAHVHDPPPPLDGALLEQFPAFAAVIEKAMAKEPSDRYSSAGDFARDAAAALEGMRYEGRPSVVATGEATVSGIDAGAVPGADAEAEPGAPTVAPGTRGTAPPQHAGDIPAPGDVTVVPRGEREPTGPRSVAEPQAGGQGAVPAAAAVASGADPPGSGSGSGPAQRDGSGGSSRRTLLFALGALIVVAGVIAAVIGLSSGSGGGGGSTTPAAPAFQAAARPVPTNHVTGSGKASIALRGDAATVTVDTGGLLNAAPHAMHIHAGGRGVCPPASAARVHNGHRAISTINGIPFYGPPQVALTTSGDTSRKSIVDFARFPSVGSIRYARTITLPPGVAGAIRADNAVVIVHGVDYNHNGIYDNALDRSDLKRSLPGESTAPALCGKLVATATQPTKTASAPGHPRVMTYAIVWQRTVATDPAPAPADTFAWFCHAPVGGKPC